MDRKLIDTCVDLNSARFYLEQAIPILERIKALPTQSKKLERVLQSIENNIQALDELAEHHEAVMRAN